METIDIVEAKKHLSKLIARVVGGEEIIISKDAKPVARMVPYQASPLPRREPGSLHGKIKILPGFDEADAEIAKLFNVDD